MINLAQERSVMVLKPQSVTAGATVTGLIDRLLVYDYCVVNACLDSEASTSSFPSVISISEADVTNSSSFVTLAPLTLGTPGNTSGYGTVPPADTQNPQIVRFSIDCRARKRYLKLSISPQATQLLSAVATLARPRLSETPGAGMVALVTA